MAVVISGKLVNGLNEPIAGATIGFTSLANRAGGTAQIPIGYTASTQTATDGTYSITLENGQFLVELNYGSLKKTLGQCVVADTTPATDLLTLLGFTDQAALNSAQQVLADIIIYKDQAAASAAAALVSENNAAASAASVDSNLIVHSPGSGLQNEAGTVYSEDVTVSKFDPTTGRILKVGDYGIGRPCISSFSTSATPNQFYKIATIELNAQYQDSQILLNIRTVGHGQIYPDQTILSVRIKQQDPFGTDPFVYLKSDLIGTLNSLSFGYVIVQNTPTSIVEVYVSINQSYAGITGSILSADNLERITINTSQTLLPSAPTGYVSTNQNWMYDSANILSNVSQNGGIPTGGIIEYGLNANGRYLKFADGSMKCWAYLPNFDGVSEPSLTANEIRDYTMPTFPATFVTAPKVTAKVQPNGSPDCYGVIYTHSESTTGFNVVFRNGATAQGFVNNYYVAHGRWFT